MDNLQRRFCRLSQFGARHADSVFAKLASTPVAKKIAQHVTEYKGKAVEYHRKLSTCTQLTTSGGSDGLHREGCQVVVQFSKKADEDLRVWVKQQILEQAPELHVNEMAFSEGDCIAFIVDVTEEGLWAGAEEIMLTKPVKAEFGGGCRAFTWNDRMRFENSDAVELFFSSAEYQDIIHYFLNSVRAPVEITIGHVHFLPGLPVVARCKRKKMVKQVFPVHHESEMKNLRKKWLTTAVWHQPFDLIQNYFGLKITLYFAWLLYYTKALTIPSIVGVLAYIHMMYYHGTKEEEYYESQYAVLISLFNVIWTTVFLEFWKRHCSTLSYHWGTLDMQIAFPLEINPEFKGKLRKNPDTGQSELVGDTWDSVRRFCVTLPILLASVGLTVGALLLMYFVKDNMKKYTHEDSYWLFVPQIALSVMVIALSTFYRWLSYTLTAYENHRLLATYDKFLVTKLCAFQFVNSYLPLFYIAFYRQDLDELKMQLAALLLTRQLSSFFLESGAPLVRRVFFQYKVKDVMAKAKKEDLTVTLTGPELESVMTPYTDTIEDYLEMMVQFGYVVLFSGAFPLAAVCALVNNVFEGRGDAFKLCSGLQRPFSKRVKNIGIWQIVLESLGFLAVAVNCAMLVVFGHFQRWMPSLSSMEVMVMVVLLEHIFLVVKAGIMQLIPDTPSWIKDEIAKAERRQQEVLLNEWRRKGGFADDNN